MSEALERYRQECFKDREFCFKSEYRIRALDKDAMRWGLIPLSTEGRTAQEELLTEIKRQEDERGFVRIVICKSRKEGLSTIIQALAIHHCQTTPHAHALTVAHETDATKELFRIGRRIVDGVDKNVFPPLSGKPKGSKLEWINGSRAECQTQGGSADSERGSTPTFLHISELPSWETARRNTSAADVAQALLNAVPDLPNTYVFVESTAKGMGNLFHEMFIRAIKNVRGNLYIPMFFSWKDNPDYRAAAPTKEQDKDELWLSERMVDAFKSDDIIAYSDAANQLGYDQVQRKRAIEFDLKPDQIRFWQQTLVNKCNSDQDRFDEEWPLSWQISFVSSGRSVFSARLVQHMMKHTAPVMEEGTMLEVDGKLSVHPDGGGWQIFHKPVKDHKYIVTSDAAGGGRGNDDDYACIQVFDRFEKAQVAEFYDKVTPDVLARQQALAATMYNNALMVPESNNHGLVVIHYLLREFPQLILYRRFCEPGKVAGHETNRLGYSTDVRTRHFMVGLFESVVRRGEIKLNSKRLLGEMLTLIRSKASGRPEAPHGHHDDAVIAMCIGIDVHKQLVEQGDASLKEPEETVEHSDFAAVFNPMARVQYDDSEDPTWL